MQQPASLAPSEWERENPGAMKPRAKSGSCGVHKNTRGDKRAAELHYDGKKHSLMGDISEDRMLRPDRPIESYHSVSVTII
jgi:hypothetical protein